YQTKTPRYCMLVFGPEARTRVWLVVDGDVLYVDRNGNGDLTEPADRIAARRKGGKFFELEEIVEADGKTRHTGLTVNQGEFSTFVSVMVEGKRRQVASYDSGGNLDFGLRAQDAPVIHFNGPLTLGRHDSKVLTRGDNPSDLVLVVGTPGLGKGT